MANPANNKTHYRHNKNASAEQPKKLTDFLPLFGSRHGEGERRCIFIPLGSLQALELFARTLFFYWRIELDEKEEECKRICEHAMRMWYGWFFLEIL